MITFGRLIERMEEDKGVGQPDTAAIGVIRSGLNIRPEFWEDFINVCGDAQGMSQLLDVPRHLVTGWGGKIREALANVDKADDEEAKGEKSETIPTGDQDPLADPNGSEPGDLRPTP
jgi:hypothetical protein